MRWRRVDRDGFVGWELDGVQLLDNGGGMGGSRGSGRWAVMVAGVWVANVDTLREAKARALVELARGR